MFFDRPIRLALAGLFPLLVTTGWADDNIFDKTVAPLLAAHCLECHAGPNPKGGLDLSTLQGATRGGKTGPAVTPGNLKQSLLWSRIVKGEMPPKAPLVGTARNTIRRWIMTGARWGSDPIDRFRFTSPSRAGYNWWSLQPLNDAHPPAVKHAAWIRSDLDRFILDRLERAGLAPAPPASPRALIRRLTIDLTGLPPDPATVAKFIADPSEAAYTTLVDSLLASPHYGQRWGRHWLDVVRFGESNGFERNAPRTTFWHYRDWVIDALNQDMPYDEFARLQVSGDLTLPGTRGAAAAGFLVAGVHNTVVGGSKRMKLLARQDELEELVGTVGQTFLGLTINCARCHDHKFDPIPTIEYYRMISALDGVAHGEREITQPQAAAQQASLQQQITQAQKHLRLIETRARRAVLATRKTKPTPPGERDRPRPIANWDFDIDLRDSIGSLHGRAIGGAKLENGALVVNGQGAYVQTERLKLPLIEKTLEAWVILDNLQQRGGGAISVQTPGGLIFDAIVFGEREPQRWMAGSNGFVRTKSFSGPGEEQATSRAVHLAITYKADGTITGYRDGQPYGKPYKTGFQRYAAGQAELIFGLRHAPAGGNKFLAARILKASLYNKALSSAAVAASAGRESGFVSEKKLLAAMSPLERKQRRKLKSDLLALEARNRELAKTARTKIYTVAPRQPGAMRVHVRGSVTDYGETVRPGGISAVPGLAADFKISADAPDRPRREQLAKWITAKTNALFVRVIVNRVWHYHFGQGLVTTPSDFGFNGGYPSHPGLLEWLAARLQDDKYRLKALHRRIVLSSVYRQSSRLNPKALERDAENRLLWRFSPRRVEAEVLRDAILSVSGQLNTKRGGPGFVDVSIIPNNGTTYYEPIDKEDPALNRRTVYRFSPRGGRSAVLDTFDCPDPSSAAPRRGVTTTPLQALSLLNNAFVLRMADHAARRIQKKAGPGADAQIHYAWQLAIQRSPDPREVQLSLTLVKKYGLSSLCRALFNTNDFIIIE